MMNAELVAGGDERIIIPTVYRNNYLVALSTLSQTGHTDALIRTLDFAQRWTRALDWQNLEAAGRELEATNAFVNPAAADEQGVRLRLP
jgi:hypothetical protein